MNFPFSLDILSGFSAALPPLALSVPVIDAAVIAIYLLATVALGLWVGRGQKNIDDYMLGDRNLPWYAVLGSIVATETSTATVLSVPGFAFAAGGDMRFLQLAIGYIIGRILVTVILLPQYFRGDLYTSYEVLNRRFGPATKSTASVLFLLTRTLSDGLRLYLAALALAAFADVNLAAAVWVMGVVTVVYTVFGGMRSVVWNDCIQLVIYIVGGFVILALVINRLPGGFEQLTQFGLETGRFQIFDFRFSLSDPYFNFKDADLFWAGLIGGIFLTLGTHGTDQLTVQRLLSARSQGDAGKALISSGFVVLGQFALFLLVGVALAAYYHSFPPGMPIENPDKAVTTFIADEMPVGLRGLLLAAVFAAAMSTLSSSLNSSASSAINDLAMPFIKNREPGWLLNLSRVLTIVFAIAQIGVALAAQPLIAAIGQEADENVVSAVLTIASFTTGIILGVFFLGVFTRRVGQYAALCGMVAGAIVTVGAFYLSATQEFGRLGMPSDFQLAWPWYACIGTLVTLAIGGLAGLMNRKN